MVNLQGFALLIETRYSKLVQRQYSRVNNENLILLKLIKSTIMLIIVKKK